MLKLPIPAIDPAVCLQAVIAGKRGYTRKLLNGCSTIVSSRYPLYDQEAPTFTGLAPTPLGNKRQGAMKRCYIRGRAPIDDLWDDLCEAQTGHLYKVCPLCGWGEVSTADHALPQTEFPEFAVYPKNLVPACGRCNTLKNERWRDARGRLFLHAYFDQVPTESFLFVDVVDVRANGAKVEYRVTPPGTVPVELAGVIRCHFEELDLANRYLSRAIGKLSVLGKGAVLVPGRTANTFRQELDRDHVPLANTWGPNHWEVALLAALRDSNAYVGYLADIAAGRTPPP